MVAEFLEGPISSIIQGVIMAFGSLILWNVKGVKSDLDKAVDDIQQIKEDLPKTYVTKTDMQRFEEHILPMLYRIEAKLDTKLDKDDYRRGQ